MSDMEMTCVLCAATDGGLDGAARHSAGRLVEESRGRLVPGPGTSLTARFASASAAVDAAERLQRLVHDSHGVPQLAIGLAAGDAELDVGRMDLAHNTPAAEATLLAQRAEPGQILVTAAVPLMLGDRQRRRFVTAGELGGGGRPLPVCELLWSPAVAGLESTLPLPPPLRLPARLPYVARPEATAVLEEAWATSLGSQQQAVVVTGEAGAGKSRLVAEFARSVYDRGALVLAGSCSPDVDLAFQPFVEALGRPLEAVSVEERRRLAGATADDLAVLLPRLSLVEERRSTDAIGDVTSERYWMFEAVAAVLENLSRRAPVVVVLEDLHWARPSTASLLDHLLANARPGRVCLLGTSRTGSTDMSDALRSVLAELPRRPGAVRLPLSGLDRAGVGELVERLVGHGLDRGLEQLVDHLAELTEGNPFLVGEQWRQLIDDGSLARQGGRWRFERSTSTAAKAPPSVRSLIDRQLARLTADARTLLSTAAVAGTDFDPAVVARAAGIPVASALGALDEARRAELVVESSGKGARFRHALVRQALHESLPAGARRAAHLALAEAVEAAHPDRLDLLAHHYTEALPLVGEDVAAGWARRAAADALAGNAYDDALATLRSVVGVVEGPELRADLLIELSGVAARAGDIRISVEATEEATAIGRRLGDRPRLVAAALALQQLIWRSPGPVELPADLLRDALEAADDEVVRARLLGALSIALAYSGRDAEALAVGDDAVAHARQVADQRVLVDVMHTALFAGWSDPAWAPRQVSLAEEGVSLARRLGEDEVELRLRCKLGFGLLLTGGGVRLRTVVAEEEPLAVRARQPILSASHAAVVHCLALNEGRLDEAERAVEAFDRWATRFSANVGGYGVMMFGLRREQGRLAELRPMAELMARLGNDEGAWLPGLAALYVEVGLVEEARRLLDRLDGEELVGGPVDTMRTVTLSYLADACAATGHAVSDAVYRALEPWSGLAVSSSALACYGSVDRYLGRLAETCRAPGVAVGHLEAAVRFDERAGWSTWAAHSNYALGRFLVGRGRSAEVERGREALLRAQRTASSLGLVTVAERATRALAHLAHRPEASTNGVVLTPRELQILRLIADGRTNREVGAVLHTSQHTVANQVHAILVKTGCGNRAEAITWAHRARLFDGVRPD